MRTGVKELSAQTPVQTPAQKDTIKARTDSIRASIEAESKRSDTAAAVIPSPSTLAPAGAKVTPPGVSLPVPGGPAPRPVTQKPLPSTAVSSPPSAGNNPEVERNIPDDAIPSRVESARLRLNETLRSLNRYEVEIQKKFALAAACFIFVLLGAPIALRFPRAGVGLTIGVSLVVFGLYYVGLIAGESLARRGIIPPFVSMWLANAVFGLIALILLARMGKETGSSRGGDFSEMLENVRYRFRRRSSIPRTSAS
jgi:lipopolysaccharide export system permease protein